MKRTEAAKPALKPVTSRALIVIYPLLHVAAVWVGLFFSSGTQTATLWTSNALLLAALIILDRRWWVPLMASVLVAEALTILFLSSHLPLSVAAFFSAANMLEALIAALLWQRLVSDRVSIFRLRDCIFMVFVVAPIAPALGGLLAGFGQIGAGDWQTFFHFWQLWWAANALGILIITPLILAWVGIDRSGWRQLLARRFELLVLLLCVIGLSVWVFWSNPESIYTVLGLPSILYPLLIWGTLRFGTSVSVGLVFLIAATAIVGTDHGHGPYVVASYTVYQSVLSLQMFLLAAAITALLLSAAYSERRVALQVLRESENKFAKAFHATPDAICIFRISDGQIIDVNDGFATVTGYSKAEALSSTLQDLGLSPLDERRRQHLDEQLPVTPTLQTNAALPVRNAVVRECEIAFETTALKGELCMICVIHDLTGIRDEEAKRQLLEARLMQARKMEAIGQLTGGIAHDFNNILFAILGNTEIAEMRAIDLQDKELVDHLQDIRLAGTRARDLVAQLLTFSRNRPADPASVDMRGAIDDALSLVRQLLPSSLTIESTVHVDNSRIVADPVQIQQVLLNLCINARDATDGKGEISILLEEPTHLPATCSSCHQSFAGDFVCLSVCDSGPGIRAEELARIFEPFYTSKEVGEGTGLGLAVVHGVVHGHGGHIVVDSKPGNTTISAFFPRSQSERPAPDATDGDELVMSDSGSLHGRVLLVDDEGVVLRVLSQMLEGFGLDVTATGNGAAALRNFEADPLAFDLVISDQTMPGITGIELARRLLAIRPGLPVILCSGFARDISATELRELGISCYLQKPVNSAEMLATVGELLDR